MSKPLLLQAIDALKVGDRDRALFCLREELRTGPPSGHRWRSVDMLAQQIGEIDIAIEAAKRFAATQPLAVERLVHYWSTLATFGREEQAEREIGRLPDHAQGHPDVLQIRGTLATDGGRFEEAEAFFRSLIAAPTSPERGWFPLSMVKKFTPDDPDIAAMEEVRGQLAAVEPDAQARFLYGLGKAYTDIGDMDRAFARYSEGARIRRRLEPYDRRATEAYVDGLVREFTSDSIEQLVHSEVQGSRSLFVNGLPRSGSTLVEQILASHSAVHDGGEINLVGPSLIPAGRRDWAGAIAYQQRSGSDDPWGDCARTYDRLIGERFGASGRIVDKSLVQSHTLGLQLHMLPDAKLVWMRRDPEDSAWSIFRNYFTRSVSWGWSLEDIAHFMTLEDRLHAHWCEIFPDRILTVPYEELVSEPEAWIPRILGHFGLDEEEGVYRFHEKKRRVKTASVTQVRSPISTKAIGQADAVADHMAPFRDAYRP